MAKPRKKPRAKKPSANTTRKVVARRGRSEPGTVKAKAGGGRSKCGAAKAISIRRNDDKKLTNDRRGTPKGKGTVKTKGGGQIGNPPHKPSAEDRRIAETHAAVGTPHWAIAAEMGISPDTLERHYAKELSLGLIRMNARIGSNVAKKALEGSTEHEKFWLARRGGPAWANKQQTELSTPPGRPIEMRDMSKLSDDELAVLA